MCGQTRLPYQHLLLHKFRLRIVPDQVLDTVCMALCARKAADASGNNVLCCV
jgi:hypothetical protein